MDVSCLLLRVSSFPLFKKAVFCWLVLFQHIVAVSRAIPTSQQHPPKAILHIASGQKKPFNKQTKDKTKQNRYNKPKHNKTKYNKQTNKRQHHIPYHQPSGPLKKNQPTVTKTPAAPRERLPCFGSNSTGLIPPLVAWLQPSRPSRP